jgi:superfamily II RNA helicase
MLPAVCFMLSKRGCLSLARGLSKGFEAKENAKRSDKHWMSKREKLETTLEELKKQYEKCKSKKLVDENSEVISDDKGDIKSEIDAIRQKLIEMLKPDPEFCVAQVSDSDIEAAFGSIPFGKSWQGLCVPAKILIPALYRGIGVHHAGLNKKYRQAVERLFRLKKLGVVFATTTLAMGINMPAKTSVLIGDAVYLNAMSFRQMSGRAGRRGFDLRGNTVLMGIPSEKCFRLLKSDLPKLQVRRVVKSP